MRASVDAARVAEQRAGERAGGDALPDAGRAVEEVRVRRPVGERSLEEALRLPLLGDVSEGGHGSPPRSRRSAVRPSTTTKRSGNRAASVRYASTARRQNASPVALDPVALAAHARERGLGVDLDQERPVGHEAADGRQVELENRVEPEIAAAALVRDGRVEVAVADDRRAALERGADHLVDVLGPGRGVERGLGPGRHVVAVEHELADCLAERRAAGLAGETTSTPSRSARSARSRAWVVLPQPSRPSNVTNIAGTLDHGDAGVGCRDARPRDRRRRLHRLAPRRRARRPR